MKINSLTKINSFLAKKFLFLYGGVLIGTPLVIFLIIGNSIAGRDISPMLYFKAYFAFLLVMGSAELLRHLMSSR